MKKNDYLALIHSHLTGIPENERVEIILDFEEHFSAGLAKGKTEDEICMDLGDPVRNASQYASGSSSRPYAGSVPPVAAAAAQGYTTNPTHVRTGGKSGSDTTYLVLFIFAVIVAAVLYISLVPVIISGGAVLVSGIAAGAVVGSWVVTLLVMSVGVFLMAVSLLILLSMTWLCIFLYKKYRQEKGALAQ
ncbi:MAG: DUF1700 domain-containing protein [Acetanaerobacterium sp.]